MLAVVTFPHLYQILGLFSRSRFLILIKTHKISRFLVKFLIYKYYGKNVTHMKLELNYWTHYSQRKFNMSYPVFDKLESFQKLDSCSKSYRSRDSIISNLLSCSSFKKSSKSIRVCSGGWNNSGMNFKVIGNFMLPQSHHFGIAQKSIDVI